MKAGTSLHASDVVLPAGVTLVTDASATVVHLSERRAAAASDDAPAAAPAAEATPAAE